MRKKTVVTSAITVAYIGAMAVAGTMAVYALRENNQKAGELYARVQAADQSGVGVEDALAALQLHVASHMNSSPLPQLGDNAPVQLSASYQRAVAAEQARVTAERERVTKEGIAVCEAQFGSARLTTRSECIANYGAANPVAPEREIVADLYRYDFVSPIWTPDRAGWLVLITVILAAGLLLRILGSLVSVFFIRSRI